MRVLLYSMWFAEFVVSLANALVDQHSVDMILCKENIAESLGLPLKKSIKKDIRYIVLPHLRKNRPLQIAQSILKAAKVVRDVHPDIIHIQDSFDPLATLLLPFFGRIPVIVEVHDPIVHQGDYNQSRIRNRLSSSLLRKRANALIAHGEFCRLLIIDQNNFPPERVFSIPLGSLPILKKWANPQVQEEPHSILFFGRMREYKGLHYLIEAEPLISAHIPDVNIILAGDGPELAKCEKKIVNPERFEIHRGFISTAEMACLFQRSSIVVLPYLEASQSAVITIAFTFGKPVVATHVGGIPDVINHGNEGYLVPPRNAGELANAVIKLLKNDQKRAEFGKAALAKAEDFLSWHSIAEKVSSVYLKILHYKSK